MKTIISAALISLAAGSAAFASVQPIPGSITYDNAGVQLEKAPAGSTFFHTFSNGDGRDVREIYKVNADKTVTLVNRTFPTLLNPKRLKQSASQDAKTSSGRLGPLHRPEPPPTQRTQGTKIMKTIISAALISLAAGSAAFASVQPIPGSITYDNAGVQLEKAPAGSTFFHTFSNGDGRDVREIYKVNADKTVTLVNRTVSNAS